MRTILHRVILATFLAATAVSLHTPITAAQVCPPDGDVNQDGSITPADALLAFRQFLGIVDLSLDACQQDRANVVDPEGSSITPADALCIFHKSLGLLSCLSTTYPILDPRFPFAAERHLGETRVGSLGTVNKRPQKSHAEVQLTCAGSGEDTRCARRFVYAFRDETDPEEFVGVFFSLGRIGISTVNPDCTRGPDLDLHNDSTFNLMSLMQNAGDDGISIESLRLVLRPDGQPQILTLRVELEDQHRGKMFIRVPFDSRSTDSVTLDLPLSKFQGSIDLTAVKLVALIIEELHEADGIINPPEGTFDIEFVGFVDEDGPNLEAAIMARLGDREIIAELARRDFEALLRLVDAKTGASLDRTLVRDLIHWGATGWLLASLPAAVNRGWITGDEARERALQILRFVDDDALWGDEPVGRIGNSRGVMYRFGGIDPTGLFGPLTGTRKIDVGDCNTVEASVIDTALFQFGAATVAAVFSTTDLRDQEIGNRVRNILNRTHWDELVDPETGQLQLGWKPERDDTLPGCFTAPAPFGGFWASHETSDGKCPDPSAAEALTIDFWTDEGAMAAILAVGSEAHPASTGTWYRMLRTFGRGVGEDVVVTFPGAWFTYTFLTATYLDPTLGLDRGKECSLDMVSVDWTSNAVKAFETYRLLSPSGQLVLPDAVELPDTTYIAQGLPELAVNSGAMFTGTRTPWSLQLAMGLDDQTATRAIAEIRRILVEQPEQWDLLFGLLDSFHPNLADFPNKSMLLRREGRWVQQQVFPLNKGPALLAQLNYLDGGVVQRTANQHPVIQRGIERIYRQRTGQIGTAGGPRTGGILRLIDAPSSFLREVLAPHLEGRVSSMGELRDIRVSMLLVFLTLGLLPHLGQTAMLRMSLEQLARQADTIVLGTVTRQVSDWDAQHTAIYTDVTLAVEHVVAGAPDAEVTFRIAGGIVGAIGMRTSNDPVFQEGERVLVFLDTTRVPASVVGLSQGKCLIKDGTVTWGEQTLTVDAFIDAIHAARR